MGRGTYDWLRRALGRDDGSAAFRVERSAVEAAAARPGVDPAFRAAAAGAATGPGVAIGTAVADPSLEVRLRQADLAGHGHTLVLGGSGVGKTRVVGGIVRWLVGQNALAPDSVGLWAQDHKSEFVALVRDLMGDVLAELPSETAYALLDRVVVIDPFSTSALVPMQVLKPEPGMRPEDQAFEVTTLVNRASGADLGVRQDDYTYHLMLLGVTTGRSLPEVATLLQNPLELARAARSSPHPEVRGYFGATDRKQLTSASLEGVRARLNKLLRLPATRLMLGGKTSVSFRKLLSESIVLVDLGSPPFGCEDIGRFWSGLVTLKLTRAIFERTHADASRPVMVAIDEWQEGLAAGGEIGDHYERALGMARSRGVSMWLASQSLAGAAKVSATLPKVVATNCDIHICFRASPEDARAMAHALPVTGRRPRPKAAPWEEASRTPFLSKNEELEQLTQEISSLPGRTFYFWNRRQGGRAVLVRAAEVTSRGSASRLVRARLQEGALAVPIAELERQAKGGDEGVFRIVDADQPLVGPTRRPK